jgi:hypothetical protein
LRAPFIPSESMVWPGCMSEDNLHQNELGSLKARIIWLEKAVQAYGPEAMDLLLSPGPVELASAPNPATERAEGPQADDVQVSRRHDLADLMRLRRKWYQGDLLWSYRRYTEALEQALGAASESVGA